MKERIFEGEQYDRSGGVPGGGSWETEWREYEENHMERPRRDDVLRPPVTPLNRINHARNLFGGRGFDGLTGFYHGTYFDKGTPRSRRP